MHKVDGAQRRHVSSHIDPPDPPDPPIHSETPEATLSNAIDIIKERTDRVPDMEASWNAYRHFKSHGQDDLLETSTLLTFASKFLDAIPRTRPRGQAKDELWKLSGTRMISLLLDLEPRVRSSTEEDQVWWLGDMARAEAYAGNFDDAITHSRELRKYELNKVQRVAQLKMYSTIIETMDRYLRPAALVDFVAEEWDNISPWVLHRPLPDTYKSINARLQGMRDLVARVVARIDNGAVILRDMEDRPEQIRLRAAEFLIETLCERGLAEDALAVLEELERQGVKAPQYCILTVVKGLSKKDRFELAANLYMSLVDEEGHLPVSRDVYVTGLQIFANRGDHMRAERHFKFIQEHGWLTTAEVATLLHCYAERGEPTRAVTIFERFFSSDTLAYQTAPAGGAAPASPLPPTEAMFSIPSTSDTSEASVPRSDDTTPTNSPPPVPMRPNTVHYTSIIRAWARVGHQKKMRRWLKRMNEAGFQADSHLFHSILDSFVKFGDIESATTTLKQMQQANTPPKPHSYTSLISLFTDRRDPDGAERILKEALREGVEPDREMLSAVMFAHVQAGNWQGVIRSFDYMKVSVARGIRMTIEVYNNLLKAYILIGAPFRVIMRVFNKLAEVNVQPDVRTYALIIQSACDAGRMVTATRLFGEMQDLASQYPSDMDVNVYVLTILMAGHLRLRDKVRAKHVLDKMENLGVQPTSVTYALILKAYGNPKAKGSIEIAENFLSEILELQGEEPWANVRGGRAAALEHVYGPVMTAYTQKAEVEDVERLYNSMLQAGGRPTLGTLTTLLDAYRRTGNLEKLYQTWSDIVQLAKESNAETEAILATISPPESARPAAPRPGNILCVPLSIYTDALSAAGDHQGIADVWKQLQEEGYTFDSHNWNHLCVALLRAGEVERAFEVVDRVILPNRQRATVAADREPQPVATPFFSDVDPKLDTTQGEAPMHKSQRRAERAAFLTMKSQPWMEPRSRDFPHPLHILYQISPAWNIWRPHNIVLEYLSRVLDHLHNGVLIKPVEAGEQGLGLSNKEDLTNVEELRKRQEMAAEMLGRIYDNYPETVSVVHEFQAWQERNRENPVKHGDRRRVSRGKSSKGSQGSKGSSRGFGLKAKYSHSK
ncbi:unnamed protein product [Somion occarium]